MATPPRRRGAAAPARSPSGAAPVSELPGVGPKVAEKLQARGLASVQDLWLHLPLRYEDRTRITDIARLLPGMTAQVEGRVEAVERAFRYRPTLRVAVTDDSRGTLVLRFFHFNKAQAAMFVPGRRILCYGEARPGQHGLEMVHPNYRFLADEGGTVLRDRLDPVYPAVEGLGPATLAKLVREALKRLPQGGELELLPAGMCDRLGLPGLREALLVRQPDRDAELGLGQLARDAEGGEVIHQRLGHAGVTQYQQLDHAGRGGVARPCHASPAWIGNSLRQASKPPSRL